MAMPAHTLPPQRNISSRHLAGNNSIIPPYSPDLAPSDFHVFLHLKTFLDSRWFHDDKVKEAVNTWFASQAASFYAAGIQQLVPRYNKCLNSGGNCRKVVYDMYIKWQYKWFGNKFLLFFNSP
jgi:hypothetical protein